MNKMQGKGVEKLGRKIIHSQSTEEVISVLRRK
jgi:hypothetical protein